MLSYYKNLGANTCAQVLILGDGIQMDRKNCPSIDIKIYVMTIFYVTVPTVTCKSVIIAFLVHALCIPIDKLFYQYIARCIVTLTIEILVT